MGQLTNKLNEFSANQIGRSAEDFYSEKAANDQLMVETAPEPHNYNPPKALPMFSTGCGLDFDYLSAACGAGKTYWFAQSLSTGGDNCGKFVLYAAPTVKLLKQTHAELAKHNLVDVELIHADNAASDETRNTAGRLNAALVNKKNLIVLTTHKTLQTIERSRFAKWELVVDEAIDVINVETIEYHHDTVEVLNNYITVNEPSETLSEYEYHRPENHLVDDINGKVIKALDIASDYDQRFITAKGLLEKNTKGNRSLEIICFNNPERFSECNSVLFMGNELDHTLMFKAYAKAEDPVVWTPKPVNNLRPRLYSFSDRVNVHYVSDKRITGKWLGDDPNVLVEMARVINNHINGQEFIWTTNTKHVNRLSPLMDGEFLSPQAQGLNNFSKLTNAVWLASMKPASHEATLITRVFNISYDEIVRAREHEVLFQFINRINIRDFKSSSKVNIYVADKEQALSIEPDETKLIKLASNIKEPIKGVSGRPTGTIKYTDKALRKRFTNWLRKQEGNKRSKQKLFDAWRIVQNAKGDNVPSSWRKDI